MLFQKVKKLQRTCVHKTALYPNPPMIIKLETLGLSVRMEYVELSIPYIFKANIRKYIPSSPTFILHDVHVRSDRCLLLILVCSSWISVNILVSVQFVVKFLVCISWRPIIIVLVDNLIKIYVLWIFQSSCSQVCYRISPCISTYQQRQKYIPYLLEVQE